MIINYIILLLYFVPASYYMRPVFRLSPLLTIFFILSACGGFVFDLGEDTSDTGDAGIIIEEEGNVIEIHSITLNPSNDIVMEVGETENITVFLSLTNADYYEAVLESDNTNIITITKNGSNSAVLTAVSAGKAAITATAKDKSAQLAVSVFPLVPQNLRQVSFDKTTEVELAWDASLGAKTYEVSRVNDDRSITPLASPSAVSYTETGLDANTYYGYEVKACVDSLCSSPVFVLAATKDLPGNNLSAIVSSGEVPSDLNNYDETSGAIFGGYAANSPVTFRYVLPGGSGDKSGSTWLNAADSLKTVLNGINDASADKVYSVLVGPGVYQAGNEMSMKDNVSISGGISRLNNFPVNAAAWPTVLSGEESYRVFANANLTSTARLHGVSIMDGKATDYGYGGGMNNNNSSPVLTKVIFSGNTADRGGGMNNNNCSPILTNVIFSGNTANQSGGGMNNNNSSPVLAKVILSENTSDRGGGMFNDASSPLLIDVTFSQNKADGGMSQGGGMYNNSSSPTLTKAVFTGNTAKMLGGGMLNNNSSPIMTRVNFSDNVSDFWGGGMINFSSSPILTKVIFSGNTSSFGGGMYNNVSFPVLTGVVFSDNTATDNQGGGNMYNNASTPTAVNSIFKGNDIVGVNSFSPKIFFSVIEGGTNNNDNNITDDPQLGPLADNGGGIDTMSIPTDSPAVNQGLYVMRSGTIYYYSLDKLSWYLEPDFFKEAIPLAVMVPITAIDLTATDMTGHPVSGRPDIGVYEAR